MCVWYHPTVVQSHQSRCIIFGIPNPALVLADGRFSLVQPFLFVGGVEVLGHVCPPIAISVDLVEDSYGFTNAFAFASHCSTVISPSCTQTRYFSFSGFSGVRSYSK